MGREKEAMIEAMTRQWWPTGKYVCECCCTAPSLQRAIRKNIVQGRGCDFCEETRAASLDYLMERHIMPAIWNEYSEAGDELAWDEGEYVGKHLDTYDFVEDIIGDYDGTGSGKLTDTLRDSIRDTHWCRSNYYGVQPEEEKLFQWRGFAQIVKHSTRYFFGSTVIEKEPSEQRETDIICFLNDLREIVERELLWRMRPQTRIYRARIDKVKHSTIQELGAPLCRKACYSNRMSPAGISMLYGAMDAHTAMAEVGKVEDGKILSLASIELTPEIQVVDFSRLPAAPDFFDLDQSPRRYLCQFLRSFVQELNAPIEKDGQEHIEYVPTQVLTEYLKTTMLIDGMVFPSARHRGGKCVVLWSTAFVPDWRGHSPGISLSAVEHYSGNGVPVG